MSIKALVYVQDLTKELLPQIVARFAEHGMECQFNPTFALDPEKDSGLVAVRLRVNSPEVVQYKDTDMVSDFEIAFKDFRYASPLSVDPAANQKLKACTKQVTIRMQATPTSALRAGMYFAAFLAELSDGVVYTPRSDKYMLPKEALDELAHQVQSYESDLPTQDWSVASFISWPN